MPALLVREFHHWLGHVPFPFAAIGPESAKSCPHYSFSGFPSTVIYRIQPETSTFHDIGLDTLSLGRPRPPPPSPVRATAECVSNLLKRAMMHPLVAVAQ